MKLDGLVGALAFIDTLGIAIALNTLLCLANVPKQVNLILLERWSGCECRSLVEQRHLTALEGQLQLARCK